MLSALMLAPLLLVVAGCASGVTRSAEPDFVPLFDGKTLDGWVTSGGHYDGNAAWTIEDGAITGRQNASREGGLIYTAKPYTEFVLKLECKLDYPFDSGIFLRMAPVGKGAQVTLDYRPDGEIGAIYADAFLAHNPSGWDLFKAKEWNDIEVRCTGADMHITATINGRPLVDYELPKGSAGYAPTGLIGLQVHGARDDPPSNKCQFRNIRIHDLAPTSSASFANGDKGTADNTGFLTPTPWGIAQGWRALFDGKTLEGWEPADGKDGYAVRDGMLVLLTKGDSGYIRTKEDFKDFAVRLDFKIAEMTNSGLFLRGDRKGGDPAWTGCEVQILDDFNWERVTGGPLQKWQFCGSLYGSVPPAVKALKPLGEWNTYEVEFKGTHITTKMNGKELYSADTDKVTVPDGHLPFAQRAKTGFIGLQRHAGQGIQGDAYAWFKNIYVKPL
jgi:hypothetical protein